MAFRTNRTVITLDGPDLIRLQEVLMDADAEAALAFAREVVAQKVECAQTESHHPAFEGDTGNTPAHFTQKGEGHPDTGESG
jgi:hypothetical protein